MTPQRYLAGVAAAVVSGLALNTGLFLQQFAVKRLAHGKNIFPGVLRSGYWLVGSGLQIVIGAPLNILGTSLIGPALTPGLIAVGLGVLPAASAIFEKARIRTRAIVGVVCVVLSAVCIGMSRLAVTMTPAMLSDTGLLVRTAVLVATAVVLAVILGFAGSKARDPGAGYLLTLSAGLWLGITTPGIGFMSAAFQKLPKGIDLAVVLVGGLAVLAAVGGSILGIGTTQQAFRHGRAHVLVPMQYLPVQIIAVLGFFLVFRPFTPPVVSDILAFAGIAGIVIGSGLLR